MKTDFVVVTYCCYLAVSICLTVWVARTLHRNGRLFLVDVFHGNEPLADSVNHLLVVGFYLINLGYVTLALKISPDEDVTNTRGSIEAFSHKIGYVLLVLGVMHFFNLYVFSRIRRRAVLEIAPPPVEPDACVMVSR
jgi:p-aminobenzoyl-glutamate transporter AbgT